MLVSKALATSFAANCRHDGSKDKDAYSSQSHRGGIAGLLRIGGFDVDDSAGDDTCALISEAWKETSDGVGRQLGEVRGDNSPRALHHELHEKGSGDQQPMIRRVRPEWNDEDAENEGGDNSPPATESVREVAKDYSAKYRSDT